MACIYAICNMVNDKLYIGQTKNSLEKRFSQHKASAINKKIRTPLYDAMRKYGVDKFAIYEIESGEFDRTELNKKEIEYIKELNTMSPNGYNILRGGDYHELPRESVEKIKSTMSGRKISWADKVSETMKKKWENDAYRNRMSIAHSKPRGKYKKHKKPLRIDIPVDEIKELHNNGFTVNAIAKKYGVAYDTIKRRLENGY